MKAHMNLVRNYGKDRDIMFLANVIMSQQSNPGKKLKNLKKWLDEGHDVRTAQFDLFSIVVDGKQVSISRLAETRVPLMSDTTFWRLATASKDYGVFHCGICGRKTYKDRWYMEEHLVKEHGDQVKALEKE